MDSSEKAYFEARLAELRCQQLERELNAPLSQPRRSRIPMVPVGAAVVFVSLVVSLYAAFFSGGGSAIEAELSEIKHLVGDLKLSSDALEKRIAALETDNQRLLAEIRNAAAAKSESPPSAAQPAAAPNPSKKTPESAAPKDSNPASETVQDIVPAIKRAIEMATEEPQSETPQHKDEKAGPNGETSPAAPKVQVEPSPASGDQKAPPTNSGTQTQPSTPPVAQPAAAPAAESSAVMRNQIDIRYQGDIPAVLITEMRNALSRSGKLPPAPASWQGGGFSSAVRYFQESDQALAGQVAESVRQFFKKEGCPLSIEAALSPLPKNPEKSGRIQVWIRHKCQ